MLTFPERYPEVLAELARLVFARARAIASDDTASTLALAVAEDIRATFGGDQIYIARGLHMALAERDAEIWREHNGRNARALAKKYDLTPSMILAILKKERAKRQSELPI